MGLLLRWGGVFFRAVFELDVFLVGEGADADFALADEFEHGEEDADHFGAAFSAFHELAEGDGFFAFDAVDDVGRVEVDGGVVVDDFVLGRLSGADLGHDTLESVKKVPDLHFIKVQGRKIFLIGVAGGGDAGKTVLVVVVFAVQGGGGFFKAFVFKELLNKLVAGVGDVAGGGGFALGGFLAGEEHGGFDFHQGGGHDEELAGEVDVDAVVAGELFDGIEIFHVGMGDMCDGDVVDIQFIAFDEVEQKVERALVIVELNAVFHCLGLILMITG